MKTQSFPAFLKSKRTLASLFTPQLITAAIGLVWAPCAFAQTPVAPPTPGSFAVTPTSSQELALSWGNVSGETAYLIQRKNPDNSWANVASVPADQTLWSDRALTAYTSKSYRVIARYTESGTNYDSAPTAEVAATTLTVPSAAKTYYVDAAFTGTEAGTASQPYKTIKKAADVAREGDTVLIHAGTYRETVTPKYSGVPGKSITYKPDGSGEVIISSADLVQPGVSGAGTWIDDGGGVYKIQLTANQGFSWSASSSTLFFNGETMQKARWPNAATKEAEINRDFMALTSAGTADVATGPDVNGKYACTYTAPGIGAFAPGSLVGASITFVPGLQWVVSGSSIDSNDGDTVHFKYAIWQSWVDGPSANDVFYLTGKRLFVDAENEYFYDGATRILYFRKPGGGAPTESDDLELLRREFAIVVNRSQIVMQDLTVIGGQIKTSEGSCQSKLKGLKCQSLYWTGVQLYGAFDSIEDSTLDHASIGAKGPDQLVRNNVVAFGGVGSSNSAPRSVIERNTIFKNSQAMGFLSAPGGKYNYNHVYDGCYFATDSTLIGLGMFAGDLEGAEMAYNWVHGSHGAAGGPNGLAGSSAIRCDGGETWGYKLHHNITWDCTAGAINLWGINADAAGYGDADVEVMHNTADKDIYFLEFTTEGNASGDDSFAGFTIKGNLAGTEIGGGPRVNRAVSADNLGTQEGGLTNGYGTASDLKWVSPFIHNYQLTADSPAKDAASVVPPYTDGFTGIAPDIGALEHGKPAFVAGAYILPRQVAALTASASGVREDGTIRVTISGFPVGRGMPEGFTLQLGGVTSSGFWHEYDFTTHRPKIVAVVNGSGLAGTLALTYRIDGTDYAGGAVAIPSPPTISGVTPVNLAAAGGQAINLTGSGFYQDADVSASLPVAGGASVQPLHIDTAALIASGVLAADARNLRVIGPDGVTKLDYWIESGLNTSKTLVWVKLPEAIATLFSGAPEATLRIQCGPATLPAVSDRDKVLPFLSKPSLKLRLTADAITQATGTSIATWPDVSGAGNHLIQSTLASQPILRLNRMNGFAAVSFDGGDDFMTMANSLGTNPCHVIAAYQNPDPGTTTWQRLASCSGNGGLLQVGWDGTGLSTPHSVPAIKADGEAMPVSLNSFTIGRQWNSGSHFTGDIGEMLLFTEQLSYADQAVIREYLSAKYQVPIPVANLSNLSKGLIVKLNGNAATNLSAVSATQITAKSPAYNGATAWVSATVTLPDGTSATLPNAVKYWNVPGQPGNLTATTVSPTQINLTWTDPGSDEDGFVIERSPNGTSGWTILITTAANVTSYSDPGAAAGTNYYRVAAKNPVSTGSYSFTANGRANNFPVFTANPVVRQNASEDSAYSATLAGSASDADGDALFYQKDNGAAWLGIAPDGTLSGTPSNSDVGINDFAIRVTDSTGRTTSGFLRITVANANDAPVFAALPGGQAVEDVAYTISVAAAASDVDAGDTLTFSRAGGATWLNVSPNGTVSGTPANDNVGPNSVVIRVTDSAGASAERTLSVTVANVNDAPVFAMNPVVAADANVGVAYNGTLAAAASDVDAGDTLTFTMVSGPAWLAVAGNGTLSGTAAGGDVGINSFTVRVSDGKGGTTEATLNITVNLNATNGTWVNAAGGQWTTATNWSGGTIANSMDSIADFSTLNLTANATVMLDGSRTVGQLKFGDTTASHDWTLNAGSGGPLTLAMSSGTPSIVVNNRTATIGAVLAGTQNLTKSGTGTLTLSGANLYSGGTTVNAGTVNVSGNQSAANGGWSINTSTVNFQAGSTVNVAGGKSVTFSNGNVETLNVFGSVNNSGSLNLYAGGTLNLENGATWTQGGNLTMQALVNYRDLRLNVKPGSSFAYTGVNTINLSGSTAPAGSGQDGSATLDISGGTFTTGQKFHNSSSNSGSTSMANLLLSGGGTLKLSADVPSLVTTTEVTPTTFQVGTGGGVIDTNGFATTLAQGITGNGSLAKRGTGTLTLAASNTYSGETTVEAGSLAVTGSLASGAVTVQAGGTLGGNGSIDGAVTVQGSLAPSGTLTINNSLTLAGSVQMELSKSGATATCDKVSGLGSITYGGALIVTDLGPDFFAAGDRFQLFAATSYSGAFSSISLPPLGGNLRWDASKLAVDGTLSVRAVPVAVADNSAVTEDGSVSIAVLANDSDADGDVLSIQSVTQGAHGNVAIAGNQVTYTPATNWNGSDSFNYTITDSKEGPSIAAVTVTVTSVNDAPTFGPLAGLNATEGQAFTGNVAHFASDIDSGDTLSFRKESGPAWLIVAPDGALSGTPTIGSAGSSSFVLRVTDSANAHADATLTITVAPDTSVPDNNGVWTNTAGGSWLTGTNWSGGLIASGTGRNADFSTLNLTADATVALNGARKLGSIIFGDTSPSHAWTLASGSGGPLTLEVASGSPVVTVNNSSATLAVALAGSQGLTKAGSGTLTLGGSNTYGGDTTVNSGTLAISGNHSAATGGWTINGGTTVQFQSGSTVGVAGGKAISFANSGTAHTLNAAGTVANAGALTLRASSTLNLNTGANWVQGGTITLQPNNSYTDALLAVNAGASLTYTGTSVVALSASTVNKQGTSTLLLNGGTFITGRGFNNTVSSASGAAYLKFSAGGTLRLSADIAALATTSGSPFQVQLGTGGGVIDTNGHSTTITQAITGSGGLTKAGTGTLTLVGPNSYAGPTTIAAGVLSMTGPNFASASSVTIAGGACLDLNFTGSDTVAALTIDGTSLPPGIYDATTHPAILTGSGSLSVISASAAPGFAMWAQASGLGGDPEHDSDQDGIADVLEYVFGTDPHAASGPVIVAQKSGDDLVITFHRDDLSELGNLQLTVEASQDLQSWPEAFEIGASTATSSPGVTIEENGESPDTITVTIPRPGAMGCFARLRVTAGW